MSSPHRSSLPRSIHRSRLSPSLISEHVPDSDPKALSPPIFSDSQQFRTSLSRKRMRTEEIGKDYDTPHHNSGRRREDNNGFSSGCHLPPVVGASHTPMNTRNRISMGSKLPAAASGAEAAPFHHKDDNDFTQIQKNIFVNGEVRGAMKRTGHEAGEPPSELDMDTGQATWTGYISGIAGRMWDFCITGAFQGFKAGGGLIHKLGPLKTTYLTTSGIPIDLTNNIPDVSSTHVGQQELSASWAEVVEDRPAKRLQTTHEGEWVVVNNKHKAITPLRTNIYPPPKSMIPKPIASKSPISLRLRTSSTSLSPAAATISPHSTNRRAASRATPRSPANASSPLHASPAAEEAKRYAAKKYRAEKENEASLRRLNQQLKDMIKEGKAALATKIEVYDDAI